MSTIDLREDAPVCQVPIRPCGHHDVVVTRRENNMFAHLLLI
jgi:hypothetical protein